MPGVLIKLPVYFDISLFFNCNGVVGRKGHSRLLPFSSLMSTLGSVLIESCRNIFTTVQRNQGYRVKLVSLYSEDLWRGERTQYNLLGKDGLSIWLLTLSPSGLCAFLPHQPFWGSLPSTSWQGWKKKWSCLCTRCLLPVCEHSISSPTCPGHSILNSER